jgi:hypothetical protein
MHVGDECYQALNATMGRTSTATDGAVTRSDVKPISGSQQQNHEAQVQDVARRWGQARARVWQ